MSNFELAIWAFPDLLVLIFIRFPIALAMLLMGAAGLYIVTGTRMMTYAVRKAATHQNEGRLIAGMLRMAFVRG